MGEQPDNDDLELNIALGLWREDLETLTDLELRALVDAITSYGDVRAVPGFDKVSGLLLGHGWDAQGRPTIPDPVRSMVLAVARVRFGTT